MQRMLSVSLSRRSRLGRSRRRIGFLSGTNPNCEVNDASFSADSQVHSATVRHQSGTGHEPVGGPVPESPCKLKGLSHT